MPVSTPSDIFGTINLLSDDDHQNRARAALDQVIRARGHGSVEELRRSLGITRSTFHDWRRGRLEPGTVYRIAVIYTNNIPAGPEALDRVIVDGPHPDADLLFAMFYDHDSRAAVTWLQTHRPTEFPT